MYIAFLAAQSYTYKCSKSSLKVSLALQLSQRARAVMQAIYAEMQVSKFTRKLRRYPIYNSKEEIYFTLVVRIA